MTNVSRTLGTMTTSARQAWEAIARLFLSNEFHQRLHGVCNRLDLSPPMLKTLLLMDDLQAASMGSLASELGCDASWVTSLVDGLEERGLVERRVLESDRRVKTVTLTDRGRRAREQAHEELSEPPPSFDRLSPDEAKHLCDLLHKALDVDVGSDRDPDSEPVST